MKWLLVSLLFCRFGLASPNVSHHWSWLIDGSPTEIRWLQNGFVVQASGQFLTVREQLCSRRLIADFKRDFEQKISSYRAPAAIPPDYTPIYLHAPGKAEAIVLRGTDLGLYLLNFAAEIRKFRFMEAGLCRR